MNHHFVIPAEAGIAGYKSVRLPVAAPASAGATGKGASA
jgi:hypothetical protein